MPLNEYTFKYDEDTGMWSIDDGATYYWTKERIDAERLALILNGWMEP